MTFYSRQDPSGQWSKLIEKQRQQQEQLERKEKEDNELRKRLYREELQRLMDEQKLNNAQKTRFDSEFNGAQLRYLQSRDEEEISKIMMIKNKEQENAKYAIEQEALKKHNLRSRLMDERIRQQEFNAVMKEAQKIEQINKLNEKERIKRDLNQAYQVQEDQKKLDEYLAKQRDQKEMEQYNNRLNEQEKRRQEYLSRLRQGYQQNNEVLQKYNEIYMQKEIQQRELQRKLVEQAAEEKRQQEELKYFLQKQQKEKMKQDTMDTIKEQIFQKQQNLRLIQSQKYQESEALENIKEAFKQIDRDQIVKKYDLQNKYRNELMVQMTSDKERRAQEASMSAAELNMNKQLIEEDNTHYGIGVVPGLSHHVDYEKQKQKAYLDRILNKSMPNSILNSRRHRNQSAYTAGNQIANNIFGN